MNGTGVVTDQPLVRSRLVRNDKCGSVFLVHMIWGLLMCAAGLFMLACGTLKTEFIVYRLMVARSRVLWGDGDAVHRFYQVSGLVVFILGALWGTGVIWNR